VLILALLALGAGAGWAAQKILDPGGPVDWSKALTQGLMGSFVGGLLASLLNGDGLAIRMSGLLGSIIGAIVVITIWNAWSSRRQRV
jgi:uncharacterized membrane protein YeaQ/YmgE (transglycosylase-associated protein family)